jgi:hypothetical protein
MRWRLLAGGTILALIGTPLAAATPPPMPTPTTESAKPRRPRSHKANGTIQAYDPGARTLTIRDSKGNAAVYALAPDLKVWVGPTSVTSDVFGTNQGTKATLKYIEAEGVRTASQVRLAAPSTKPRTP